MPVPGRAEDRPHDVVLFGATGFVGRLTARALADAAPAGLRVALAGRSRGRLERVRDELPPAAANWPVLVADSADVPSLDELTASTGPTPSRAPPEPGWCTRAVSTPSRRISACC